MKKIASKYFVEFLCILDILLILLPLYVAFQPRNGETLEAYLALCSFIAWIPVAAVTSIVASHRLFTAKDIAPGTPRLFGIVLSIATLLLNSYAIYVIFIARMF